MRTFVKLGSVSLLALAVACGGSGGDGGEGQGGADPNAAQTPGAGGGDGVGGPAANGADDGARKSAINELVGAGGTLTTDAVADPAPVAKDKPTTSTVPGENGSTLQCTTTTYSLTKIPSEFVLLTPNADVLWPGSLVQGKSMASGVLDPIPVKRAPGTITLSLASSAAGQYSKKMDEASLSAAVQAQNDILSGFTGATPAMFSIDIESVYSNEQLAVAIDAQATGKTWSAAASLKFDQNTTKSHVLIKFAQQYYTMAFDPPQGASGVFDKSVTADDLAPYVGPGNPAVYVASVTYGRIFYLLFESSESQKSLEAAISGSYSGAALSASGAASADWKKTINNAHIQSYALGGNADAALGAVTAASQFDQVLEFLKKGANFDSQNPGVPVSYKLRNLKDSSEVKLALTTSYTAKNCEAIAVGCDGVLGSGKVKDVCGVCGGLGNTCNPCAATTKMYKKGNGAYVEFTVAAGTHGQITSFPDGSHEEYHFPTCRRVFWGGVRAQCSNGTWSMISPTSVSDDADCVPADKNDGWSDNSGNAISTGYSP